MLRALAIAAHSFSCNRAKRSWASLRISSVLVEHAFTTGVAGAVVDASADADRELSVAVGMRGDPEDGGAEHVAVDSPEAG